jgi:hypothetical protein
LVPRLYQDPELDVSETVEALLMTMLQTCIRFDQYSAFPYSMWECCAAYNPTKYPEAIQRMLETDDHMLDAGWTLPLKKRALSSGRTLMSAVSFLMRPCEQDDMFQILSHVLSHSFDAERKHAHAKGGVHKDRVMSVGAASRNLVLNQYRKARGLALGQVISDRKWAMKRKYMNAWLGELHCA